MPIHENEIVVEVAGPQVTPATIEPVSFVSLAAVYLGLLQRLSRQQGSELVLEGLALRGERVAMVCRTSQVPLARALTDRVRMFLQNPERVPYEVYQDMERLRAALLGLPEGSKASIYIGNNAWKVDFPAQERNSYMTTNLHQFGTMRASEGPRTAGSSSAAEILCIRARPVLVGGSSPSVGFESESEQHPFALAIEEELARQIAVYLYREVEIEAEAYRDESQRISGGKLLHFEVVDDADASEKWRSWYQEHASEWDDVNDIEADLDRSVD
jgi:hypothetical protein